jgi:hypothetical protein
MLDNGFFPKPVIFYRTRKNLIHLLKTLECLIKLYPIKKINIIIVNFNDVLVDRTKIKRYLDGKQQYFNLLKDELVLDLLSVIDKNWDFASFNYSPLIHPFWFFKTQMQKYSKFGKILLTPLLFSDILTNRNNVMNNDSLESVNQKKIHLAFLNVKQKQYEIYIKKIYGSQLINKSLKTQYNFKLDVGKDDILDVLDSI